MYDLALRARVLCSGPPLHTVKVEEVRAGVDDTSGVQHIELNATLFKPSIKLAQALIYQEIK